MEFQIFLTVGKFDMTPIHPENFKSIDLAKL